jgi:glutaredoxin
MAKNLCLILYLLSACLLAGWTQPQPVQADDQVITVYLFWTEGCPHCAHEKAFLAKLHRAHPSMKIVMLDLSGRPDKRELFQKVGKSLNADISGVPFTVIGKHYLIGWQDEATTGRALVAAIKEARRAGTPDIVAALRAEPSPLLPPAPVPAIQAIPATLNVPLFGQIHLKYLSLGLVTVIIGALDGFNPCAMWVLIFLINLLLGMADRKKCGFWAAPLLSPPERFISCL